MQALNPAFLAICLIFLAMLSITLGILLGSYFQKNKELRQNLEQKSEDLEYYSLQLEAVQTDLNNNLAFRERMISIVIHDLKSPLSFLYKLAKRVDTHYAEIKEEERKEYLTELAHSAYQINGFVADMLTWLNSNHNQFILKQEPIKLSQFIQEKCGVYKEIIEAKKLALQFGFPADFMLKTDPNLLLIILRNLLDNAIKYTQKGQICIAAFYEDGKQIITVQDSGDGMKTDKIIELENGVITKKTSESSQIGFRIVYDLVAKLKGQIKVKSIEGKGTTVIIALPK